MSNEELDEIKAKKEELEAELDRIQTELDSSIDKVRSDVSHKLKPSEIIKQYPIPVVGVSLLVGFLAGHKPKRSSGASHTKEGFTSLLLSELKKLATRKAVTAATDYLDEFLEGKKEDLVNGVDELTNDKA
ncbi:hypothetical protein NC796_03185 [Aliifodinibius sp. S!AR15-10]|uniref:hypothetical protein n=1 Tax=Aliifodinibius sp. S!AR15-10 TaxID=2950437 RepID=UPI0028640D81|nr:hypothetical protein [Aliifodinibius sp. S!AR15-10]MDR8390129.1 hypothetical protein [Aliifodinibius sp. S!AR15-10]